MTETTTFEGFTAGDGLHPHLEGIHGNIHAETGNGGNMNFTDCAAFDPIFFIYHAYVIHPLVKLLM